MKPIVIITTVRGERLEYEEDGNFTWAQDVLSNALDQHDLSSEDIADVSIEMRVVKLPPFEISISSPWDRSLKSVHVKGPGELGMFVDYDDVDHDDVQVLTEKMVRVLNEHWHDDA